MKIRAHQAHKGVNGLTVIFAILVGHIEWKKLTENAGLKSHTMPIAEEQNMSI